MIQRIAILLLSCLAAASLLGAPAAAAITDVPAGGTVFVGEQGLNITVTGIIPGGQIARFGAGGTIQTDAPSDVVVVSDPASFYVVPGTFGTATGAWYTWPGRELAFIVKDPSLQVRVINTRTGREPGSGFVSGDPLGFRIETNLYSMAQRPGVTGAPVTVHVRDPTGAEFTSLMGPGGVMTSLVEIPVNSSVYETGPVWTTDTAHYRVGTYEVWADCNANRIRDNYDPLPDGERPGGRTDRPLDHRGRHREADHDSASDHVRDDHPGGNGDPWNSRHDRWGDGNGDRDHRHG